MITKTQLRPLLTALTKMELFTDSSRGFVELGADKTTLYAMAVGGVMDPLRAMVMTIPQGVGEELDEPYQDAKDFREIYRYMRAGETLLSLKRELRVHVPKFGELGAGVPQYSAPEWATESQEGGEIQARLCSNWIRTQFAGGNNTKPLGSITASPEDWKHLLGMMPRDADSGEQPSHASWLYAELDMGRTSQDITAKDGRHWTNLSLRGKLKSGGEAQRIMIPRHIIEILATQKGQGADVVEILIGTAPAEGGMTVHMNLVELNVAITFLTTNDKITTPDINLGELVLLTSVHHRMPQHQVDRLLEFVTTTQVQLKSPQSTLPAYTVPQLRDLMLKAEGAELSIYEGWSGEAVTQTYDGGEEMHSAMATPVSYYHLWRAVNHIKKASISHNEGYLLIKGEIHNSRVTTYLKYNRSQQQR